MTSLLQQTDFLHVMPIDVANYCARFEMLGVVPISVQCTMDSYGIITKAGQLLSTRAKILIEASWCVSGELSSLPDIGLTAAS